MKKLLAILLAAASLLGLAACGDKENEPESAGIMTLVAAFNGEGEENWKEYLVEYDDYEGDGYTVEEMAMGLRELTGLDFGVSDVSNAGATTMLIDISQDSALFAGPPDPQKEEFYFFDYDSMAWFMLDSLARTIRRNIPAMGQGVSGYDIYFTMNGGESLVLENLSPPMDFTLDTPYMGSAFYFAHQDGRGDLIEDEGGGDGRGDYLPESPADVNWRGEYRGNAGILRISNFDKNAEGIWHFRFELISVEEEDDGVAAIDPDAYAVAEYASYQFTFSPGETEDGDLITVTGGTAFDGEYPRFDPDAMG
jgi:hypothetical protein